MIRTTLFVTVFGLVALTFADGPTPIDGQPLPKQAATQTRIDATTCACAIYPIYQETYLGTVNTLYYTEVCTPATACSLTDVAYYWASDLLWPLECNPNGEQNNCDNCVQNKLRLKLLGAQPPNSDATAPFRGMDAPKHKADTIRDQIFPLAVTWNNGTEVARPRKGVVAEYTKDFYVKFVLGRETIYAKLFIVRVKADNNVGAANTTKSDRLLFIGYEIDDLSDLEKENALPATNVTAAFRKKEVDSAYDSNFALSVPIGRDKFLVLLARPKS